MRGVLIALGLVLALAGCREGATPSAPPLSDPLAEATVSCGREGGRMMSAPGASKAKVCVRDTSDFGKRCTRSGECEGDCLARSGTCSPATPMFGCHEILMGQGQKATLCRD